jgi:colicin import membrane protein
MRTLACLILLSLSAPTVMATQTVYKCVEADGTIVYSEQPCSTDPGKIETIVTTGADTAGSRDALAEQSEFVRMNDVRRRCDARINAINNDYAAQYRRIADEIARVEEQIRGVDYRVRGSTYDTDLRRRIPVLEQERAKLEAAESDELSVARERCQVEIDAEETRQAEARDERAEAKHAAEEAAAEKAAAEKAAAERAAAKAKLEQGGAPQQ